MGENAKAAEPTPGADRAAAPQSLRPLTRGQLERLRTVSDSPVPERHRRLVDLRYPWHPRPYFRVPRTARALMGFGLLLAALNVNHLTGLLSGLALASAAAVLGFGANALLWRNERRAKRIYETALALSFPATDMQNIAQEQPGLGVLIWRIQQAADGIRESEASEQELLIGVLTPTTLTSAQYDLVSQIVELADEQALLSQAAGRPALDDLLRPRLDAAAVRLASITASVEQLEAIHAEVALLDEHLADLRIAEQILGHDSAPIPELTNLPPSPGGLSDAAVGIRSLREFVVAHRFGNEAP